MSHAAVHPTIVPVYVWQAPVRLTHWLIAGSIVVLSVTGLYIGYPFYTVSGAAGQHFVMGWTRIIHFYAAIVFICSVVARVFWMFTGNKYAKWDKFIPIHPTRMKGILPTAMFYSFLRPMPPSYVGHNPLAGGAYSLVFGLYFLAIATGLVMWSASYADAGSPLRWFASWAGLFGGLQMTRWIHHIVMWLLLGFAVHHVYSSILVANLEKNGTLDSIFSGWKWVHTADLEPGPYRWTHKGELDE